MRRALRGLRARLRDTFFRQAAERDMDEELRFHVDMETDKYVRQGLEPAEARRRALVAFGGIERHRERLRERRRVPALEPIWHDVRFGLRSLGRAPGLSAVAIVTIALGVGATTTVSSAANAILLRPLPLPDAGRVFSIQERRNGMVSNGIEGMLIPYERYIAYRAAAGDVFDALAAHRLEDGFYLRLPDETLSVTGSLTSGNFFETLGVRPELGRAYTSDAAAEVVVSHELWATHFARDPAVIGRTVSLDGHQVAVVGVAPAGFGAVKFEAVQVWAPVGLRGEDRSGWNTRMVPLGRLRPGVPPERAQARVDGLSRTIPPEEGTTVRGADLDAISSIPGAARRPTSVFLAMLVGMGLLVLLIGAANIGGVLLSRGFARRREMAVRLAIGAGRGQVARHLLAESLLLFAVGGLAGVGLAYIGTGWLMHLELPPQVPATLIDYAPDHRVLAVAIVITGLAGILFGLIPALQASRPELVPALKDGGGGGAGGGNGLRHAFVVGQVALAVTLLLTATLFARSVWAGLTTDPGFDADGVVSATIHGHGDRAANLAFQRRLLQRVSAIPGVQTAALTHYVPLSGSRSSGDVGRPDAPDVPRTNASYSSVSAAFFETMRVPIVAGRPFDDDDDDGAPAVAIINETLAGRLWPGESPLGQRLQGGFMRSAEVVGVTSAGRYQFLTEAPTAFVYLPYRQVYQSTMSVVLRAPGVEPAVLRALAATVRELDPDRALTLPASVSDLLSASLFPQRFGAQLVGTFGVVGLVLAALGIYGVLAHQVGRRKREIGVRRALGATSGRVVAGIVARGGRLVAIGCVVGIGAGAGLARGVRGFLFGIRPLDPVTFVAVPALIAAVAILASWLPARRAAAVQASEALRSE